MSKEREIRLYNSLTKQKDVLKPVKKGLVSMYHCGPTVYNYAHIGNIGTYIFSDILRRTVEYNGYEVKQVINITDFGHIQNDMDSGEDKMMAGLKREGLPISMEGLSELAKKCTESFVNDLDLLNILPPTLMPPATGYISDYIELIEKLLERKKAYIIDAGVYFDTESIDNYGKLGGLPDELQSRLEDNSQKKNPRDFVLWKKSDKFGWNSPWGNGFPGWHIECSAISMKCLGETFDIHTGGIDHIPVHHNNEIAQSESATGKPLANIWMHRAHIRYNGERLEKSKGNVVYVKDLIEKKVSPLSYRYWTLLSHYRTGSDFSFEAVTSAQKALENIVEKLIGVSEGKVIAEEKEKFILAMNDDLNTPVAVSILQGLFSTNNLIEDIKATVYDFDKVLGLDIENLVKKVEQKISNSNEHIKSLLKKRELARESKDWALSDEIRELVLKHGFVIKDTPNGEQIRPISLLF